jgi:hypothetical protein
MKDLFQKPYHEELHEILLKKGYSHRKRYDSFFKKNNDTYSKDGRTIIFWEDDHIMTAEKDGSELTLEIFSQETNNIFDPDKMEP